MGRRPKTEIPPDVVEMHRLMMTGWSMTKIGEKFGVTRQAVHRRLGYWDLMPEFNHVTPFISLARQKYKKAVLKPAIALYDTMPIREIAKKLGASEGPLGVHLRQAGYFKPVAEYEHGTYERYTNRKCRCDLCREANTEHFRQYRKRKQLQGAAS